MIAFSAGFIKNPMTTGIVFCPVYYILDRYRFDCEDLNESVRFRFVKADGFGQFDVFNNRKYANNSR